MKKILILLAIAFAIISVCMIMLTTKGVSLRAATLISPSTVQDFPKHVAEVVVHPLFPAFKSNDILLVGVSAGSRMEALLPEIRAAAEVRLKTAFHVPVDPGRLEECPRPCWVVVKPEEAQQLVPNDYIDKVVRPLGRRFFTLNLIEFDSFDPTRLEFCEAEKRLDLECLVTLSIKAAHRKMKDPAQRYFFMRKYNHSDYFLFVQKP